MSSHLLMRNMNLLYILIKKDVDREESIIARSCNWLKPIKKVEFESVWNKYVIDKQDKVRRKLNFLYEELTFHNPYLSEHLENPFLIRLFLELNIGKELPKSRVGFISNWTLFHEKIIAQ